MTDTIFLRYSMGDHESPRKEMIYYHDDKIFAARKGDFKLYYYRNNPTGYPEKLKNYTLSIVQSTTGSIGAIRYC